MQPIILASTSPRRKELFQLLDLSFTIESAEVDEQYEDHLTPQEIVMTLAERKALAVFDKHPEAIVIGSDTIVVHQNKILGKPLNKQEAFDMLKRLSGDIHSVLTGVSIISQRKKVNFFREALVHFSILSDQEIEGYISTDEPYDKAGGYGIQGRAAKFIESIRGDYYTIMGLPVNALYQHLKEFLIS